MDHKNLKSREICVPIGPEDYKEIITDPIKFRASIDASIKKYPDIFPKNINSGYHMKDIYYSKKLNIKKRRIDIGGVSYSIRPSFVMPYMVSTTSEACGPLFFRRFGVPFWALAEVFGYDSMHWYRMEQSLGRFSLVGTTIRKPDLLPNHILADEKHTKLRGEKAYVATTVANECIWGCQFLKMLEMMLF